MGQLDEQKQEKDSEEEYDVAFLDALVAAGMENTEEDVATLDALVAGGTDGNNSEARLSQDEDLLALDAMVYRPKEDEKIQARLSQDEDLLMSDALVAGGTPQEYDHDSLTSEAKTDPKYLEQVVAGNKADDIFAPSREFINNQLSEDQKEKFEKVTLAAEQAAETHDTGKKDEDLLMLDALVEEDEKIYERNKNIKEKLEPYLKKYHLEISDDFSNISHKDSGISLSISYDDIGDYDTWDWASLAEGLATKIKEKRNKNIKEKLESYLKRYHLEISDDFSNISHKDSGISLSISYDDIGDYDTWDWESLAKGLATEIKKKRFKKLLGNNKYLRINKDGTKIYHEKYNRIVVDIDYPEQVMKIINKKDNDATILKYLMGEDIRKYEGSSEEEKKIPSAEKCIENAIGTITEMINMIDYQMALEKEKRILYKIRNFFSFREKESKRLKRWLEKASKEWVNEEYEKERRKEKRILYKIRNFFFFREKESKRLKRWLDSFKSETTTSPSASVINGFTTTSNASVVEPSIIATNMTSTSRKKLI